MYLADIEKMAIFVENIAQKYNVTSTVQNTLYLNR